jgi:hypothetical protein
MKPADLVVLSDLENVIDLCKERVSLWEKETPHHATVTVIPLGWGSDPTAALELGPYTHILLCDLVSVMILSQLMYRSTFRTSILPYYALSWK